MKLSSAKSKIMAVVLVAGVVPFLVTLVAQMIFGDARRVQEPIHECLELVGSCVALAVAILLLLRSEHDDSSPHLLWVVSALVAMGLMDGVHGVTPFGTAFAWTRHGATLIGGVVFALVWLPPPPVAGRRKWLFVSLVAVLALLGALGLWWRPEWLPAPWVAGNYSFAVKAVNGLGGLGFMAAALFFLRRYLRGQRMEDLVFASHTVLFGTASLCFGFSHVWAADWWAWHGFRLLAYAVVLIAAYEVVVTLYQQIARHAQELEGRVETRTAELLKANDVLRLEILERQKVEVEVKRRGVDQARLNTELTRSNRATLNLMQDAIAAKDRLEQTNQDLRREITQRQQAEAEICRLNAGLEQRVLDRTAQLEASARQLQAEIAERRQAQQAQARLVAIIEATPDFVGFADARDAHILYINPAGRKMTGLAEDEDVTQLKIPDVHPEWTNQMFREVILPTATREGVWTGECAFLHREGREIPVMTVLLAHKSPSGEVERFSTISRDITERKRAEEALALQARIATLFLTVPDDEMFNEVLKVILEVMHSPFGVFGYLDEAGALVVPTMTRQIWDKCQVPEKTIIFPSATWGDSSWPRAIREKQANHSNEVSTKAPEGHVTVTRHISLPILFQGEVLGLFQVANKETDYTEADIRTLEAIAGHVAPLLNARLRRERAEAEIQQLNEQLRRNIAQLEAANHELESFAYSVSHDLRAPLRGIDGWSQALVEDYGGKLDDQAREYLAQVCGEAQRMGQLIDDLLQLSRVTRAELRREPADLSALARGILASLRQHEGQRQVEIVVAPGLTATGDSQLLRLVLENLLGNAWKFSGKRPQARIEFGQVVGPLPSAGGTPSAASGDAAYNGVVFFIRDNGAGFDMAHTTKLFAPFQRLHRPSEFPGTGIGLATVQRIIRRHGGKVWAEAERDKGATFYFTLSTNESNYD